MNAITTKLMLLYVLIVALLFAALTYGLLYFTEDYFYKQTVEEMKSHGETFQEVLAKEGELFLPSLRYLFKELDELEAYAGASAWLIAATGDLYYNYDQEGTNLLREEIDFEEVKKVLQGETIIRESRFAALDNQHHLTMMMPIRFGGRIQYVLYINREIAGLSASMKEVQGLGIAALFIATFLITLGSWWITRSIRKTLKKFTAAIRYVGRGNYEYALDTDRKDELGELAKEFNAMSRALKDIDGMRRKFISEISHDFRSPLTSIKGFTKGMLDGTIPPKDHARYLEIVYDEALRLHHLAEEMLELSRLQAGALSYEKTTYPLDEQISSLVITYQGKLAEKGLHLYYQPNQDQWVYADENQIGRVFSNLLENAIKFSPEGESITIATKNLQDKILVTITNTGVGIPTEDLPKIWYRFSKLDETRGSVKSSSGLGLAIVKEIIEGHGEFIDVSSGDNQVAFAFTLPKGKK